MKASTEADLVVGLAVRAAEASHRAGPGAHQRTVVATAKLVGEAAGDWAEARVLEESTAAVGSASTVGSASAVAASTAAASEAARADAADAVALATCLADGDAAAPGADRMAAPTGVVVVAPGAAGSVTDVVGSVLAVLVAGGAVVVVTPRGAPQATAATVAALAAAAVEAGGPGGVVQCVTPEVGSVAADDPRVARVIFGRPTGAVPVLAGPDADPVALAGTLLADAGRPGGGGPSAPTVLIAPPGLLRALSSAGEGLCLLGRDETDALRRWRATDPVLGPGGGRADLVADAAGFEVAAGARVLLAPVAALVPEEQLARPWSVAVVGVVPADDATRAVRAARAAVRVAGGPGPVIAVHGGAWRQVVLAAAPAAGFGRVVVDGPTSPSDPLDAAVVRPSVLRRWTRVTGWTGPWPDPVGPAGPQPPYPHPSNRGPG